MAFVRVNSFGWATNDILLSSQTNQLDIDHANALDKSAAGDTLVGVVTMGALAQLVSNFSGQIVGNAVGSMAAFATGAIESLVQGGFKLNGGSSDYPIFGSTRTRVVNSPLFPQYVDGSSFQAAGLQGIIAGQCANTPLVLLFPYMHNGSTLSEVDIAITVNGSHTSGLPASLPSLDIRRGSAFNPTTSNVSLLSGGPISPAPASGAAWYNGGVQQKWSVVTNQNNVVDTANYFYYMLLLDEQGTHSFPSNYYTGMATQFTNISDMRFP